MALIYKMLSEIILNNLPGELEEFKKYDNFSG